VLRRIARGLGLIAPPPPGPPRWKFVTPDGLSYATVEDYCDSKENLTNLASIAGDLKDMQRPWCFKAVLSKVPRGGRLLEIGGGDPHVANMLVHEGYEVWVIDPYEGDGRGPTDFREIRRQFPKVNFIRGRFPQDLGALGDNATFDAIYSISVLEHIPPEQRSTVTKSIPAYLKPGGWNIHAIDHITHGLGAADHRAMLGDFARDFGFTQANLDEVLNRLDDDPETYYLSADGHNLWRGNQPYWDFPMRRCVSVQVCHQPSR
jgi:hypothetical protein